MLENPYLDRTLSKKTHSTLSKALDIKFDHQIPTINFSVNFIDKLMGKHDVFVNRTTSHKARLFKRYNFRKNKSKPGIKNFRNDLELEVTKTNGSDLIERTGIFNFRNQGNIGRSVM